MQLLVSSPLLFLGVVSLSWMPRRLRDLVTLRGVVDLGILVATGRRWFPLCKVLSGFLQSRCYRLALVPFHPESGHLMRSSISEGVYQFRAWCFELTTSPQVLHTGDGFFVVFSSKDPTVLIPPVPTVCWSWIGTWIQQTLPRLLPRGGLPPSVLCSGQSLQT